MRALALFGSLSDSTNLVNIVNVSCRFASMAFFLGRPTTGANFVRVGGLIRGSVAVSVGASGGMGVSAGVGVVSVRRALWLQTLLLVADSLPECLVCTVAPVRL